MNKTIANIICAFVPSKKKRDVLRKAFCKQDLGLYEAKSFNPNFIVNGQNNKLITIDEQGNESSMITNIPGMKINIRGNNNIVKIHLPLRSRNTSLDMRNDDCSCEIGPSKGNFNVSIVMSSGRGQKCIIGRNTTIESASIV